MINDEFRLFGIRYLSGYADQIRGSDIATLELASELGFIFQKLLFNDVRESQLGQDVFALVASGFKREGFFIEVGAHHPVNLSNSWMLERHFGWRGILVEPNPTAAEELRRVRSATVDQRAAWRYSDQEIKFRLTVDSALSSCSDVDPQDLHDRSDYRECIVQTIRLNDLLTHHSAPEYIDYVSIDVEGGELEVLAGLDLSKWRVGVLTIEHNHNASRLEGLDAALEPHGYVRVLRTVSDFDAFYIRKNDFERFRYRGKLAMLDNLCNLGYS